MSDVSQKVKNIAKISGSSISDENVERITKIAAFLDLSRNDPFLSVLVTLEHYFGMCKTIPDEISNKIEKVKLIEARSRALRWLCVSIIICFLIVCFTAFQAYKLGKEDALAVSKSYEKIDHLLSRVDEDFFATDFLVDVYDMYKNGDLEDIVYCKKKGWTIDDGYCTPRIYIDPDGNRSYSAWKIPSK